MRISDWSSDVCSSDLGLYPGDYLIPVGKALAEEFGDRYASAPESGWLDLFRERAVATMLEMIREDLALLGITHEVFSSEAELQASGKPDEAEAWLRSKGLDRKSTRLNSSH